jgi:hypothetical protein
MEKNQIKQTLEQRNIRQTIVLYKDKRVNVPRRHNISNGTAAKGMIQKLMELAGETENSIIIKSLNNDRVSKQKISKDTEKPNIIIYQYDLINVCRIL